VPPAIFRRVLLCCLCLASFASRAQAADAGYFFAATRAFDEGRYEDVLTSLAEGPETDRGRYLAARAQAALSRFADALRTFSEAPASFPPGVRDDFDVLRAEWAAAAGQCAELGQWGRALDTERRARLTAECAFRAGDFATAIQALEGASDVPGRSLFAQALFKAGRTDDAAAIARKLWIEAPAHREADTWKQLATHASPLVLDDAEHIARAEAWLSSHRAEEAITELSDIEESGSRAERAKLWHLRGEALFKSRKRYPEASKAFDKAAAFEGATEAYDAFHAVRALSRAGHDREAIKRYQKFAKAYPKSALAGDALYLAAWLSAREKLPNADRMLQDFTSSEAARAQPGLRRDALWDLAWLAIEANKPKDALRLLVKVPDDPKPMPNSQRSYWRAHSLFASGDEAAAKLAFRETLWIDPLNWYAQLAARRLMAMGEALPTPYPSSTEVTSQPPGLAQPAVSVPEDVRFYRALGLYADASRAAERATQGLKDRLTLAAAHSASGDPVRSHATAEPLLPSLLKGPPTPDNDWLWRAAFPSPYGELVRSATEARGLPTTLFYGHMQVESRYKPAVVSGADAIGLMQLLPGTAQSVAKGLGLSVDRTSLKRPSQNIPLGAAYLSGLVRRYDNQFPLAIAAYNAGTQRVDGWLARGCPCELDRWVEGIPVEQTRNYVRRVVTAWARYHYFTTPSDPWGVALPAQVMPPTK